MHFDVTIEIPRGSGNKYEVDHATGQIRLDRAVFVSMVFPQDYGSIDETLGDDGDPPPMPSYSFPVPRSPALSSTSGRDAPHGRRERRRRQDPHRPERR
jgi:hypothetical protein